MSRGLAYRIHQEKRIVDKRSTYEIVKHSTNKQFVIKNPKPCSCYMCGNPRKYWKKKTHQENKADLK